MMTTSPLEGAQGTRLAGPRLLCAGGTAPRGRRVQTCGTLVSSLWAHTQHASPRHRTSPVQLVECVCVSFVRECMIKYVLEGGNYIERGMHQRDRKKVNQS